MLVLARREGEGFLIKVGDKEVKVLLCSISGSRVRIGVDAPSDVRIIRDEVQDRGEQRCQQIITPITRD